MDVGIPDVAVGKFAGVSSLSPRGCRAVVGPAVSPLRGVKLPPIFAVVAPRIRVRVFESVLGPCRWLGRSGLPGDVVALGLAKGLKDMLPRAPVGDHDVVKELSEPCDILFGD